MTLTDEYGELNFTVIKLNTSELIIERKKGSEYYSKMTFKKIDKKPVDSKIQPSQIDCYWEGSQSPEFVIKFKYSGEKVIQMIQSRSDDGEPYTFTTDILYDGKKVTESDDRGYSGSHTLNDKGFVMNSKAFLGNGTDEYKYEYNAEGYLTKMVENYNYSTDTIYMSYSGGNMIQMITAHEYGKNTYVVTSSNYENKNGMVISNFDGMPLDGFRAGLTFGVPTRNLISRIENINKPNEYLDYKYEFNSKGYITKIIETGDNGNNIYVIKY